jgi:membrane protein required for beta-lactamase induction
MKKKRPGLYWNPIAFALSTPVLFVCLFLLARLFSSVAHPWIQYLPWWAILIVSAGAGGLLALEAEVADRPIIEGRRSGDKKTLDE